MHPAASPVKKYGRAVLIYNPVAGGNPRKKERQIRRVAEILRPCVETLEIAPTEGPGGGRELAASAVEKNVSLIIVCGGDGTINEVVNGMAGSRIPLAVLSGGTANVLARNLKMPRSPVRAARAFVKWEPRRIGLGYVSWLGSEQEGRFFLSVAGVGFDATVIRNLSSKSKLWLGKVAYGLEGLRQWWRCRFIPFVFVSGDIYQHVTFAVLGRTPRYGGGIRITPGASLFSDRFVACIFHGAGRLTYLKYLAGIVTGLHPKYRDVDVKPMSSLEFLSSTDSGRDGGVGVEVDGELAGELPARFDLKPDMLTLLAPPGSR